MTDPETTRTGMKQTRIIRSNRQTTVIEVTPDDQVIIRVPLGMPIKKVQQILDEKSDWIEKKLKQDEKRRAARPEQEPLCPEDIRKLADQSVLEIPKKVAKYAQEMGVTYGRITIRNQRSRWGSCSGKGNLNFNCLLMLAPEDVLDYVIVHELAHRREMNHSANFWHEVEQVLPDYKHQKSWLKEYGRDLMARVRW